jgi:uncharacterized protein (DUF433 family)
MEPAKHIEITPGVCGGRPRVAGTRIRIASVVRWTEQGLAPKDIVAAHPQLTPAECMRPSPTTLIALKKSKLRCEKTRAS